MSNEQDAMLSWDKMQQVTELVHEQCISRTAKSKTPLKEVPLEALIGGLAEVMKSLMHHVDGLTQTVDDDVLPGLEGVRNAIDAVEETVSEGRL